MRVLLRPLRPEDAEPITRLLENDLEGISRTFRIPWPFTLRDAEEWLAKVLTDQHTFAILTGQSEFAGCIGARESVSGDLLEIGYWVGSPFRRQGVAKQALGLLLTHLRAHTKAKRAEAQVFPGNEGSIRVLQSHGFRPTGEIEKNVPLRGGLRTVLVFALDLTDLLE
ncbi:MAG: GNAT family N-acetyltransferase [Bryobacteraceae bacterium]|nr:GNAT family N-acetyltransferase [Bryobacteraceae bacterium]